MRTKIIPAQKVDLRDLISRSPVANMVGAEATLARCIKSSEIWWAGFVDDRVACVWGLVRPSILVNSAYLWLITTDLVKEHTFMFVRRSQIEVAKMLEVCDEIIGDCILGDYRAMRWLRWLGAEFSDPVGGRVPFRIVKHG